MQLLVSVANASEARHAVNGGADLIDAKDPLNGALGAVSVDNLRQIHRAVADRRVVTAALGDARDERSIERAALDYAATGVGLLKVGFAGITALAHVDQLLTAAVRGVRARAIPCAVVAVAYADTGGSTSVEPKALAEIAWRAGATGVLLDTALKDGPGLCDLMTPPALASWVATSHGFGLMVALAGKLTADDLPLLQDTGADIVGFRGAACERGRSSSIAENKVRLLSASLRSANGAVAPSAFALRLHCNPIATAIPTATRLSTNSATQSGTAKRSQSS